MVLLLILIWTTSRPIWLLYDNSNDNNNTNVDLFFLEQF